MAGVRTEFFSMTEIGGVGEMIYKAVRFPEYVSEYDCERKEETIVPVFTYFHPPEVGPDFSLTGQDLLASLCNLYKKINAPEYTESVSDMVLDWCRNNVHPYDIENICEQMQQEQYFDLYRNGSIRILATFDVKTFIADLCKLGRAFEYYDALRSVKTGNIECGRNLYYEGRICDSMPFLEHFRHCKTDKEYLGEFLKEYDRLMSDFLEVFPDIKMILKKNPKNKKVELGAKVDSVFDIAWYSFARFVAEVAPPIDDDLDYMEYQGAVLTCMACGEYFVRHSSRQRYCDKPCCQAARNNAKARAYYARKKEKR